MADEVVLVRSHLGRPFRIGRRERYIWRSRTAGVVESVTRQGILRVRLKPHYRVHRIRHNHGGEGAVIIPRDDADDRSGILVEVDPEAWPRQVWQTTAVRQTELDAIWEEHAARQAARDRAPRALGSGRTGLLEIEDGEAPPPLALLDDPRSREQLMTDLEEQTRELEMERRRLDRLASASRLQEDSLQWYRGQTERSLDAHQADKDLIREVRAQRDELREQLLTADEASRELKRTIALYQGSSREVSELSSQGSAGLERLQGQIKNHLDAVSRIQAHLAELSADAMRCQICHDRLADRVLVPCGHTICQGCMNAHFRSQQGGFYGDYGPREATCPFCRAAVDQEQHIRRV